MKLLYILMLLTLFTSPATFSQNNEAWNTLERQFDIKILKELTKASSLVVVGLIVAQPEIDHRTMTNYVIDGKPMMVALSENAPFTVEIQRVLSGEVSTNRLITVGLKRDEVSFRYPTNEALIFFLKPGLPPATKHLKSGDWRTVSDYFGIIPYQLTLERVIKPLKPEVRTLPDVSKPDSQADKK